MTRTRTRTNPSRGSRSLTRTRTRTRTSPSRRSPSLTRTRTRTRTNPSRRSPSLTRTRTRTRTRTNPSRRSPSLTRTMTRTRTNPSRRSPSLTRTRTRTRTNPSRRSPSLTRTRTMTGVTSTMNRHRRRSLVTNDEIKKVLLAKRERPIISREGAVSTGSTLLNLACSDHPDCGFFKGAYYYLVGDSTSGKTWLSLSCFAEACLNSHFRDYRLIFDDVEGGDMMDMAYYFGERAAKRLEAPALSQRKGPINSDTVESFYYHISDLIKDGRP